MNLLSLINRFLCQSVWILLVAFCFAARAAAPNVAPLGAWSAQLHGPARVAADAEGNLYVTDPAAGRVVVFNAFGQQTAVHEGFAGPLAIAVASDGRIYLSEEKFGSVSVFDPQWSLLYQLGAGTNEFQLPGHLAVDPRSPETVYVSDSPANLVRVYNGRNQTSQFGGAGTGDGQFHFPVGIAVRTNGEVFVLDQNNDRVEVFTNGIFARKFPLGTGGMFGGLSGRSQALFADDAGRVFVADTMQGNVRIFDADTGSPLGAIGDFGDASGQLNLPLGLVVDGLNRLCVASANNSRVELFGVDNFLHLSASAPSGNLAAGGNLLISVTVGGTNGAGFQWRKDGVNVSGATNANFTVAGAGLGDSGNYSVVVSRSSGVVTSSVAPVTVLNPPNIWSGPAGRKILAGATANLSVVAAGSGLKYQWQLNGQDLAGATNATLVLADAQAAQSGEYAVRVSNAVGAVTSAPATVTVVTPPLVMDLISSLLLPDRSLQLTLNADAGFSYDLEATEDFVEWTTVTNLTADGLLDYTDAGATNRPSRYYRLRWSP